jgi:hypothetical protein
MTPAARAAGILPKSPRGAMGADGFTIQETTT